MAVKEAKIAVTVTLELDEDRLRDMFENYEVKFTKKKVKELNEEINDNEADWITEMEEAFEEIVGNWLSEMFNE